MPHSDLALATWLLIITYMLCTIYLVVRGAFQTKNISDYAIGSIVFSPVAVGLSLAASMTSAATFIINPGFIALYGWSGFLSMGIVLPAAALISLYILTKGFRKQGKMIKALTMAQWIGNCYENKNFAMFFGFLSLLLITFIVLICVGLTQILSKSLDLEQLPVLIGIVVFVFGYMMFGGANSMVYTNTIQAVIMLIVAFVLLGSGYTHFSNGISGFINELAVIDVRLVQPTNPSSFLFRDYFEIVFCQIMVGVAIVCQPHILTKSLILNNERDVNIYLWVGITAEIIFFLLVFTGLYARLTFPDLTFEGKPLKVDEIMSAYVIKEFSVYIGLLVVLGFISAGISTLEGLIQSISTTITADIVKPLFGEFIFERGYISEVWFNRGVIILLGIITIYVSYGQLVNANLSVGIFAQNGVYAYFSAAFVPVLFGTFLKNVPLIAPVSASIVAVVVHFGIYYGGITPYMQQSVRNPGIASALALVASILVGGMVYLFAARGLKMTVEEKS